MADIPKLFGIDIGYGYLKIAETERKNKAFSIKTLGSAPIGKDILKEDSESSMDFLTTSLINAAKEAKIDTKNCVITVPESLVYSRLLSIPQIDTQTTKGSKKNLDLTDKVAEQVYWSLKPLIPVDLETVNVSFIEVGSYQENGKEYTDWYTVAAPKQLVDKVQRFVQKAGFTLLAVETEALANTRMIKASYQLTGDTLVVDFGMHKSYITLVRNGNTAFSQSVEIGSDQLTNDLMTGFGIPATQAEQYKLQVGLQTDGANGNVAQSLIPTIDRLIAEISRMVTYSRNKLRSPGITGVFITGGGSKLINIAPYIGSKLQIQTIVSDSYRGFDLNQNIKQKIESTVSTMDFSVAIGLSLKGII